jgi:hydrogenase nickel incorporation protein HypA/HybF
MHEYALAECVLDETILAANGAGPDAIREVCVEVGPLAGVEPVLLRDAFETLAADRLGRSCRLVVKEVPLRAVCESCREEFAPTLFDFACSACGSTSTRVIQGDGLILKSVILEDCEGRSAAEWTEKGGRRDG